jgi:Membrane protease subunits, stomatin/prohibitin homologs
MKIKEKKMGIFFLILFITSVIFFLFNSLQIVPESKVFVIERLGKYHVSFESGLHFLIPFFDKVARKVSLKEQVVDFPPQPVITKDNATMQIDTVVYFYVTDPKLYAYGVERPMSAIENLTSTTLRNIIGDMTVDETLTSRDTVNTKMRSFLDTATDPWGIKINRVELQKIIPPADIRNAMEKEIKAEREKRANVLDAQAKREAAILVAQGEKEATILRAQARREQQIMEAEGKAKAIISIQEAKAHAFKVMNETPPSAPILSLRSLEALEKVADGKATKIIIPSEIQNLGGFISALGEINKNN